MTKLSYISRALYALRLITTGQAGDVSGGVCVGPDSAGCMQPYGCDDEEPGCAGQEVLCLGISCAFDAVSAYGPESSRHRSAKNMDL